MPPLRSFFNQRLWLIDLICLGFLCLLFYSFYLGSYPLFTPDEGRYSEAAREMISTGNYITPHVNGVVFLDKPILYYWFQAAAIKLFGIKEWALRFFPTLIGIFGILIVYLYGKILFDRRTALLAAIILATSPLYFIGAHYANLDLEVAVFISTALLSFLTGTQSQQRLRKFFFFVAYFFAALAFLTKGLIGIVFPSLIGLAWLICTRQLVLLKEIYILRGLLLFTALSLPWYILVQNANPNFLHYFFVTQQVTRFLSADVFNNRTYIWFYIPVILIGFFPWTCFLVQASARYAKAIFVDPSKNNIQLFLFLWVMIVLVFFSIPHSKIATYILPVFPPLALLIAKYFSDQWLSRRYYFNVTYFVISLFFSSTLLGIWHLQITEISPMFKPYLFAMLCIILAGATISLFLTKAKSLFPIFTLCAVSSMFFLLTLVGGATYLNHTTAKPLIEVVKPFMQKNDEIVTYFKFYQDVPLYLGTRVTIVADWDSPDIPYKDNWLREIWLGKTFQNTDDWLINETTFWKKFEGNKRIFVFLPANYFKQFKNHAKQYFLLKQANDILLISNQPLLSLNTQNLLEAKVNSGKIVKTIKSAI